MVNFLWHLNVRCWSETLPSCYLYTVPGADLSKTFDRCTVPDLGWWLLYRGTEVSTFWRKQSLWKATVLSYCTTIDYVQQKTALHSGWTPTLGKWWMTLWDLYFYYYHIPNTSPDQTCQLHFSRTFWSNCLFQIYPVCLGLKFYLKTCISS